MIEEQILFYEGPEWEPADTGTSRAIGFTIGLISNLYGTFGISTINIKKTKTQTLHTIGAAIVINNRKPGLPGLYLICFTAIFIFY